MKEKKSEVKRTLSVKERLTHLFSLGFKEDDACMCVGITTNEFNKMLEETEGLEAHFKQQQGKILAKSYLNVAEAIDNGDVQTSKWYIEQKRREQLDDDKKAAEARNRERMSRSHFDIMRESLDRDYSYTDVKPN